MRANPALIGIVLSFAALAHPANASPMAVFGWSLTSPNFGGFNTSPVIGSGTLTATEGMGGAWTVDAVAGSFTDLALAGTPSYAVIGVGPVETNVLGVTNDNDVYPSGPLFLDTSGLSFETTTGPIDIFWSPSDNNYEVTSHLGIGTGTFALTAVPLPPTLAMFASGLALAGFVSGRKKRKRDANAPHSNSLDLCI